MQTISIAGKKIGEKQRTFVIAEAGLNHNGRLALALKLVDAAARAGADVVKFQTFRAGQVVIEKGKMASYQKRNIGKTTSQQEMLRKLELLEKWYPKLIEHCRRRGILFLSTPHGGFDSVDLLAKYNVPAFKFGSGDLTNTPLLEYAARLKKPMIVSTGMATLPEVKEAVHSIRKARNNKIILLHATTNYPTPPKEVNLRAMQTLRKLGVVVGYSDHTEGTGTSIAAVMLGACVIEKHFTLDRTLPGPDHKASLEPDELAQMVREIRAMPLILGDGIKRPQKSERAMIQTVRKSIVSARAIKKGERFTKENLAIKRPGNGIPPRKWSTILRKRAVQSIPADTKLLYKHFF